MHRQQRNTPQTVRKGLPARPHQAKRRIVLVPYTEPRRDARTPLAVFLNSLLTESL